LIAAYNEGSIDVLLMRAVDALVGLPVILFALLFSVTLGPGFQPLVMALILISWAAYARVVRSEALSLKHREFFVAARALRPPGAILGVFSWRHARGARLGPALSFAICGLMSSRR